MTNPFGYPMLSQQQHKALFPHKSRPENDKSLVQAVADEFAHFGISVPVAPSDPVSAHFVLPPIKGHSIVESVEMMAEQMLGKRLQYLFDLAALKPQFPEVDVNQLHNGWTKLSTGESVPFPNSECLVIDVETFVKRDNFAVMAAALSVEGDWYIWLHSQLREQAYTQHELIPIGPGRLVVNHAVTFDATRFAESYTVETDLDKRMLLLDTMAITNACNGFSGRQRWATNVRDKQTLPQWAYRGHANSLVETYEFHCSHEGLFPEGKKELRDIFVNADHITQIAAHLDALVQYNIRDVYYTQRVFANAFPKYRRKCPSLVSLYGLMASTAFQLPVVEDWYDWVNQTEAVYNQKQNEISRLLHVLADKWVVEGPDPSCPWKSQLDWTVKPRTRRMKGMPEWYRNMGQLTAKSRLASILLKMSWDGHPIYYVPRRGFCYGPDATQVPRDKEGNVATVLTKDFNDAFEQHVLQSNTNDETATQVLELARSLTYWAGFRTRVFSQFALPGHMPDGTPCRVIVPNLRGGTVTGRATDSLWLTVCSTKKDKVGTELKSRIQTPAGWYFVKGDHTGQELRIAAILGDSIRGFTGSSLMSFSILSGDKNLGTDSHSMLAKRVAELSRVPSFPRVHAKTVGYAILYMGGVKTISVPIRHGLPHLPWDECYRVAKETLEYRKGRRCGPIYVGGTDSPAFNAIDRICNEKRPRTPILKREAPDPMCPEFCGNDFYTSRGNWVVQASARDQLDVFITVYDYMARERQLSSRIIWAMHDEMVAIANGDEARAAANVFQIAHAYTWSSLHEAVGLYDMCAVGLLLDSVEIDNIFRKEATEDTRTPSQLNYEGEGLILRPEDFVPIETNVL